MFQNLTDRLNKVLRNLTGQGRISEKNVREVLKNVRFSLLEADVALEVVTSFLKRIKHRSMGQEVIKSLSPGQTMIKIIKQELTKLMGGKNETLNLNSQPPVIILVVGLQGSGKTTTVAKLAQLLIKTQKKKVMVASVDVNRPAAMKQLEILVQDIDVEYISSGSHKEPLKIAENILKTAYLQVADILIIDTAGRSHADLKLMHELVELQKIFNPIETLFVLDSMSGQDTSNMIKIFNKKILLTGIILSKADSDARGGAALSIRYLTGKIIKFIGVGENIDDLEYFYPDRIASRILGMDDMLSLIEGIEKKNYLS